MKFGFVTCVQLGLTCMETLYEAGFRLDLAVTLLDEQARSKSGRVFLDDFCARHAIPLLKTRHINDDAAVTAIVDHQIDWLFIIGWSQIAAPRTLTAPRRGVLGIHPTLLPEGRGRAAIPWAIIKGLRETGVTLFQLDAGVDTGPILAQRRLPLAPDETSTRLYARVNEAHSELLREALPLLATDQIQPVPQDPAAGSYWPGRTPDDGRISAEMTVAEVDRLVRATTRPYPGAFWDAPGGRRLRIWAGTARAAGPGTQQPSITLADGVFEATEYDWEQLPA